MRTVSRICALMIMIFSLITVSGQESNDNKSAMIKGEKGDPVSFEYYTITSRTETPYFIAKTFGISTEEIYAYNPEVTRFKPGTIIRIPRWEKRSTKPDIIDGQIFEDDNSSSKDLIMHEVLPGETLYSISRKYQISESEILFFNPSAKKLKAGSIIYIPVQLAEDKETGHSEPGEIDISDSSKKPISTEESIFETDNFFEHTILSGETMWSITRKYNVTEEELRELNPSMGSGFPAGFTLHIPVKSSDIIPPTPANEDAFYYHKVEPKETLYGLSAKYEISIPDIRKFNPVLETRNPVIGEIVLIPKTLELPEPEDEIVPEITEEENKESLIEDDFAEVIEDDISPSLLWNSDYYKIDYQINIPDQCLPDNSGKRKEYRIALFLPLFITENEQANLELFFNDVTEEDSLETDTKVFESEINITEEDSLVEQEVIKEKEYVFYRDSENYLQFYEGVILAIDSMKRAGMNIRLDVYDSRQNIDSIRKYIYKKEFLESDLIIGPVFTHQQEEVAAIAAKNRIAMISPLSSQSDEIDNNSWYFQINPNREILIDKTADLIADEFFNSNLIIIETANSFNFKEADVINKVRERLEPSGYWNHPGGITVNRYKYQKGFSGFTNLLSNDKKNVIFISSLNEGDLSIILSNLTNLAGKYDFSLVGFSRYEQFKSISYEQYHKLNLNYVSPYWVDYNDSNTYQFLRKFRSNFFSEPGSFAIQGYDIAFYFLNALKNYGPNFSECLPYLQLNQIQGSYRFEKMTSHGGYMNQGVSVISYEHNFDVVRKRISGPVRVAQLDAP